MIQPVITDKLSACLELQALVSATRPNERLEADVYWLAKTNVEGVDVGTISTDLNPASLSQAR